MIAKSFFTGVPINLQSCVSDFHTSDTHTSDTHTSNTHILALLMIFSTEYDLDTNLDSSAKNFFAFQIPREGQTATLTPKV